MTSRFSARSARTSPVSWTPASALALLALAPASAEAGGADPPVLWVSTTSNVNGGGAVPAVDDGELWRLRQGESPRIQFAAGHWTASRAVAPGDVDALALLPSMPPGSSAALSFSTLGNLDGTLDGDVLGLDPGGGYRVIVAEAELALALGVPDAALDLDAIAWDPDGRLYFSLQEDLAGTVLGDVANGDVLRLEAGGGVTRPLTEADVQAALTAATGSTASVGDVHGVEWTPAGLWVLVQSPSSADGGVLQTGAFPAMVLGDVEGGLNGAELDALARVPDGGDAGALTVEPATLAAGEAGAVRLAGLEPGALHLVVWSGSSGALPDPWLGGWGSWGFAPGDPWVAQQAATGSWFVLAANATGEAQLSFQMPSATLTDAGAYGGVGWSLQALDLSNLELLAPFRAGY